MYKFNIFNLSNFVPKGTDCIIYLIKIIKNKKTYLINLHGLIFCILFFINN